MNILNISVVKNNPNDSYFSFDNSFSFYEKSNKFLDKSNQDDSTEHSDKNQMSYSNILDDLNKIKYSKTFYKISDKIFNYDFASSYKFNPIEKYKPLLSNKLKKEVLEIKKEVPKTKKLYLKSSKLQQNY